MASRVAEEFESQARSVELIISDVDGTLLNEQQQLTPGVQAAAVAAAAAGVPLIVATGKAMGPWRDVVLPHIGSRMPQVSLLWGCWQATSPGTLSKRCTLYAAMLYTVWLGTVVL